jgi:hypothetical protein
MKTMIPIASEMITLPNTLRTTLNQIGKPNKINPSKFYSSIKLNEIKTNDMRSQKKQYQQEEKNHLNNLQE